MKKMISLAVILSCVLSVPAFADGPNDGHRPGQPTVWQNGPDHDGHAPQGGPDAHHQGDHDQRGPDRDGHDNAIWHVMSRTISPGAGTISAKATRLRRRSVAMNIASATGATAACRPRRKAITGPISTVTMC